MFYVTSWVCFNCRDCILTVFLNIMIMTVFTSPDTIYPNHSLCQGWKGVWWGPLCPVNFILSIIIPPNHIESNNHPWLPFHSTRLTSEKGGGTLTSVSRGGTKDPSSFWNTSSQNVQSDAGLLLDIIYSCCFASNSPLRGLNISCATSWICWNWRDYVYPSC